MRREANFLFGLPSDMADDLEQLMRVFKVKICERVCPGFWSSVGIPPQDSCMERRMCHLDPRPETHWRWSTAFGFDGKKPLEQAKWHRDHRRWARVCATVQTHLTRKKHHTSGPWLGQRCMWSRTDQKHRMLRKTQGGECRVQHVR